MSSGKLENWRFCCGMEPVNSPPEATSINAQDRHLLDDVKKFVGNRSQSDDMCLTCFGRRG
jgi:hypothetical protein